MKPKVNIKKKIQVTQQLEKEAKSMEEQLLQLKLLMQEQKSKRVDPAQTRWKAATQDKALRNYAGGILQQKRMNDNLKKQQQKVQRPVSAQKQQQVPKIDKDVDEFLNSIGMTQYREKFMIYSMASLKSNRHLNQRDNITNQKLREMGILPGHQIKIMRAIKDIEQVAEDSFYQLSSVHQEIKETQICQTKQSCWLCYKLYDSESFTSQNRNFCSEECLQSFQQQFVMECSKCNQPFYKNDGVLVYDQYYCSHVCSQAYDQIHGVNTHTTESLSYQDGIDIDDTNYAEQFNEFMTSSLMQFNHHEQL